ncbi:MAG: PP2C family protein-serine/threonine phosphatase [Nocardioides sp.]
MSRSRRGLLGRSGAYVGDRVRSWQSGSQEGQVSVLLILLGCVAVAFLVSWYAYEWMPFPTYFIWLLIGMLLLRFVPLCILSAVVFVAAIVSMRHYGEITGPRTVAVVSLVIVIWLILYQSSRQRSGLPVPLSEAMLAELRDRLQRQSVIPELPEGWGAQSAMRSSAGAGYAGDFFVADLIEGRRLEMVLVDVCGKGVAVGPQALQFAGALGGLLGSLPPRKLMLAANRFLLRQRSDESFSTAVHLRVDLVTGEYTITSAGHPPALHWEAEEGEWAIDNARGTALGITQDPDLHASEGMLAPGEGLLFYTDGVVESRSADIDEGIAWLRETARNAVESGFAGAAQRIIRRVANAGDDRAVLILSRSGPVRAENGIPAASTGLDS